MRFGTWSENVALLTVFDREFKKKLQDGLRGHKEQLTGDVVVLLVMYKHPL